MAKGHPRKTGGKSIACKFDDFTFEWLNKLAEHRNQSFGSLVGSLCGEIATDTISSEVH